MFAYLATAAVMCLVLPAFNFESLALQPLSVIQKTFLYFFDILEQEVVTGVTLLKFHIPCILIAAIVVNVKLKSQLGSLRFLKSMVIVALVLLPSFLGMLYLAKALLPSQLEYFMSLV
jgi:hypothetical protein